MTTDVRIIQFHPPQIEFPDVPEVTGEVRIVLPDVPGVTYGRKGYRE